MLKLIGLFLLALVSQAQAQSPIRQSGTVTPRHLACWTTTGVIQDCGTAALPVTSSLGAWGSGPSICSYSDNPASSPGYQQLCMGATTAGGGQISVQNFGTASAQPLTFNINGTPVSLPIPSGSGVFVTTPTPATASAVSCFSGTTGAIGACTTLSSALVAGAGLSYSGINLTYNIGALSAETSPDATNDYIPMRRASDGAMVKINPTTIAGTNTAGVGSVGGLAGTVGISTGITTSGNSILVNTATIPALATNNTYTGSNTFAIGKVSNIAGLVCDGTTNNYSVVSTAATAANLVGADLIFPPGVCVIDMTGQTAIPIRGGIVGASIGYTYPATGVTNSGTTFFIKGTTAAPFSLLSRSVARNLTFVWPNQTVPSAPTVYPAAIEINGAAGILIDNVTMVNAYVGIQMLGGAGFVTVSNSRISSFTDAITSGTTLAENQIYGNDFTYAWGDQFYDALGVQADWRTAYQASSIGIHYTGTNADAQLIKHNAFFANKFAILVSHVSADAYFWGSITGNMFDGNIIGVGFTGTARPVQTAITGNTFNYQLTGTASTHIGLAMTGSTTSYDVAITGNNFSCSRAQHISISSPTTQIGDVTVAGNMFTCMGYNQSTGGPYYSSLFAGDALTVTYGTNTVDGLTNTFTRAVLANPMATLTATGNTLLRTAVGFEIGTVGIATIVGNSKSAVDTPVTGAASTQKETANSWN